MTYPYVHRSARPAAAQTSTRKAPSRRRGAKLLTRLVAGALLFLALGRAIGDVAHDPLIGLVGASLVIATIAALSAPTRSPLARRVRAGRANRP